MLCSNAAAFTRVQIWGEDAEIKLSIFAKVPLVRGGGGSAGAAAKERDWWGGTLPNESGRKTMTVKEAIMTVTESKPEYFIVSNLL